MGDSSARLGLGPPPFWAAASLSPSPAFLISPARGRILQSLTERTPALNPRGQNVPPGQPQTVPRVPERVGACSLKCSYWFPTPAPPPGTCLKLAQNAEVCLQSGLPGPHDLVND